MAQRTRLDRLVRIRERGEETAREDLALARSNLARAAERLAGLRQDARSDGRGRGAAELWLVEECAHVRVLQSVRTAERDLGAALSREQAASAGYATAHRGAEVVRRARGKKLDELAEDAERRELRALDEAATLRFNSAT